MALLFQCSKMETKNVGVAACRNAINLKKCEKRKIRKMVKCVHP